MKARATLAIVSITLVALIGCAPGAGAESPPESPGPSESASGGQSTRVYPTSTPWPSFGPPPVTADSIAATVQAALSTATNPSTTEATPTAPAIPGALGAANDVPFIGFGSPTSVRPATPIDDSATFKPVLPYSYSLSLDWEEIIGDDEIVLAHSSGSARITLRERTVSRSSAEPVTDILSRLVPVEFVDWNERSVSDSRVTGTNSYRREYAGTKQGEPHVAVVDWYLWGVLLVEVVTEAEANAWAADTNLRNTAMLLAASFATDGTTSLATSVEINNQLRVRFNDRVSGIFVDSANGAPRVQLSCRQVLLDLLSQPFYVGSGEWQVFALTNQGAQVWQIFEPTLNIVSAAHNTGSC